MKAVLEALSSAPKRVGGVLDVPLAEFAKNLASVRVASLLEAYADAHDAPTLRTILRDARFQRWVAITPHRSPLRQDLATELELVSHIVEEEYILDDEDDDDGEAEPGDPIAFALRAWALKAGVAMRFDDPVTIVASRSPGWLQRTIFHHGHRTIGDAIDGKLLLDARSQAALFAAAERHVREAGERTMAARRDEERVAKLGYMPASEGAHVFIAALDAALARVSHRKAPDSVAVSTVLENDPLRLLVRMEGAGGDRRGKQTASLRFEGWRSSPLERLVTGPAKLAPIVLAAARRVLVDPQHRAHAEVVAYLDEQPWERIVRSVDVLARRGALAPRPARIVWRVFDEREVRIQPFVRDARSGAVHAVSIDDLARGAALDLAPADEAVARALQSALSARHVYGFERSVSARGAMLHALSLLVGHGDVQTPSGARLRVHEGAIGASFEAHEGAFRLAFDVGGEPIGAAALRSSIDDGALIHVDLRGGRVLVSRVGARREMLLDTLASEEATFPADAARAFIDHLDLGHLVSVRVPPGLAGEPIDADARPLVRVLREDDELTLAWLVQPIGGGAIHTSGEQPEQVRATRDGRAVFAVRSFERERALRDAIRSRMPQPAETSHGADLHRGIEAMLAVIATLREAVAASEIVVEWPKSLPRVVGTATFDKLRVRVTSQRDWFGIEGAVHVEGGEITLAELMEARRARSAYIVVGEDALVAIDDELRARLGELESIARPARDGLALGAAAAPALAEWAVSRERLDAAPAFWSLMERIDRAHASEPTVPRAFAKILRPYQVEGFRWMSRLAAWGAGACLADEMGLGKTVQTLALLVARQSIGPALVVAPTSVGPNWMDETKRFAPKLKPILHRGTERSTSLAKLGPGDLVVTSYDILVRDHAMLSKIAFATLVVDEAQAVKNAATARAKAVRALRAEFRLALTGTPVENRLAELHSLMELLNPGLFGSEDEFRARYVVPIERDRDAEKSAELARVVRPFLLRRRKSTVLSELPARTEITRSVEPAQGEKRLYEAARRTALEALQDEEDGRFRILAEIMRLRRLACHPRLFDETSRVPSSKREAFLELVAELREGGHRALVFSQFTGHLALVEEALRERGVRYQYLDGKTPLAERTRRVAAFQAGEGDLFLISLKAGGTGLNLTAADTVIHLDPWWNPAVEDQATDRAHRIGQTRPVTVVRLIAQGTIEEAVVSLHHEKRALAEAILDGAGASGKLSIAELGALIRAGA